MIDKNVLKTLAKECLSIVSTSTLKDNEIEMDIMAGVNDLKRQGIDVEKNINDELIQSAIIMYVKANFGMLDLNDKKYALDTYKMHCHSLSLSQDYLLEENESD